MTLTTAPNAISHLTENDEISYACRHVVAFWVHKHIMTCSKLLQTLKYPPDVSGIHINMSVRLRH